MKTNDLNFLFSYAGSVTEPEDLFSGRRLPLGFSLPDNILVFFHDFTASAPNSHSRHTLVIPLDEMIYYVEHQQVEMHLGELLYVPPFALRFLHPGSSGYRRLFITFEVNGLQHYLPRSGLFELTSEVLRSLRNFLRKFLTHSAEELAWALMQLLAQLSSAHLAIKAGETLPDVLLQVIDHIECDLATLGDVKQLAAQVGLSPSHLRALFRQHFGVPIGKYIAQKRADYAKYQLKNSNLTIGEIAQKSGFATIYVFSTFFKRNVGVAPLQYRKQVHASTKKAPGST
ncbi:MAG: HTH-type transcriptional activator RhaR [Lentisphaerae bacterium ADurb.Bin082]|nr:MAG: HTH-type transcriptional activator RhaR [Lentisphaerae bacterium ADurb.Bin082]HQL86546.1 AraC family transcriptional regulator [Lentisphaeria bacterium]